MDALDFHWLMIDSMGRFKTHIEGIILPYCNENSITPQQLKILMALHFEGPLTVNSLAKRTCMAGTNNSAMCKRLDGEGLVTRQRLPNDERHVMVSLTPQGEAIIADLKENCTLHYTALVKTFSQDDMDTILTGMNRLLAVLGDTNTTEN